MQSKDNFRIVCSKDRDVDALLNGLDENKTQVEKDVGNQHRKQSSRDANRFAKDSYPPSSFFA
jgi:hypothetical protein